MREPAAEDLEIQLLQNAIVAYLHYRNTVPLTAIAMPDPIGPPTAAMKTVRGWEAKFAAAANTVLGGADRKTLTEALWGLLDVKATAYLAAYPDLVLDLAKLKPDPKALPAIVVADHVLSMEQTYPACCARRTSAPRSAPSCRTRALRRRSSMKWKERSKLR